MDKKSRLENSKGYENDKYIVSWLKGLNERTMSYWVIDQQKRGNV